MGAKIKYNSPAILSFSLFSALILLLNNTFFPNLIQSFFLIPGKNQFSFSHVLNWFRLFTHVAGHADWNHLISNFAIILLIGPILEELYGSFTIFFMILTTAFITGILNAVFFSTSLLGASGVAFMMVLLISFTNFKRGEIPLTFILILILYLGREILNALFDAENGISEFAHIVGGFCGSLFGFFNGEAMTKPKKSSPKPKSTENLL